jgi:hypothetical protein
MTNLVNLPKLIWPDLTWSDFTWSNLALPSLSLPNMATLDLIAIAVILLGLCFWLVASTSDARLKKTIAKESDESLYEPQFKCVVFVAGNSACNKALKYETKPILDKNAPKLPLLGCMAAKCECRLMQHDDRRSGTDRRDKEVLDKRRKSVYANKRLVSDRRRASIQEFLLPKYRTLV